MALLAGVSALALFSHVAPSEARPLGYSSAYSATSVASDAAQAASQQAAAMAKQAQSSLTRATHALQSMQAAQAAARNAAASAGTNGVTDGLSAGGLIVDPRIAAGTPNLWVNARLPTQTSAGGQTTVTVQQTSQRAIMTWQQFNVGRNTTLYFDQRGGNSSNGNSWVALNRVDATGSPSQILGSIKAEGTLLLINPNGIIFTGTSQINVHTLIASSMDINSFGGQSANVGVFNASGGYTSFSVSGANFLAPVNEDSGNTAFLSSGLFANGLTGNASGTLVLSAGIGAGANAGVQVQAGASISTNVSGFDNGGLVALIGPHVTNAGSIETAAGQIVLAAGNNVLLTAPASGSTQTSFTFANASGDTTAFADAKVPGFSSNHPGYLAAAVPGGAVAVNDSSGILTSTRGNITLLGDSVAQLGFAGATTSITRAGSITITATLGNTVFGPGSSTTILPDENGETIPSDTKSLAAFVAPHIDITTTNLDMQPNSLILAPGANMTVSSVPGGGSLPLGRVLLEGGSEIDLAGLTGVTRSVADYLYTFKVTANDVADSPLASSLIGQTVTIDLSLTGTRADGETWVGSPLFASSGAGYLSNIPRNIDQLLTRGGSLSIGGGSGATLLDALTAAGSVIDVSGGWIRYTGGIVNTTRLVGSDGRFYDIGSADPFIGNRIANGFVRDHSRWNVTETWTDPLRSKGYYKPDYIDGVSAGGVAVAAVNPVLEGDIAGDIVTGLHQLVLGQTGTAAGGSQLTPDQLPNGAALTINFKAGGGITTAVVLDRSAPDILGGGFGIGSALNLPSNTITYSTTALSATGLGAITIQGAPTLAMNEGASLSVLPGGSVTLNNVTSIDGTITAHGGKISIAGFTPTATSSNGNPTAYVFPLAYENLVLGSHAVLDVSGLWVNDSGADGAAFQGSAFVNGGSVSLTTYALSHPVSTSSVNGVTNVNAADGTASIVLNAGSVIDVSSGGYVGYNGKLKLGSDGLPVGNGGSVSLTTYNHIPNSSWASATVPDNLYDQDSNQYAPGATNAATVVMDGTIRAGGLTTGGAFTLQAPTIVVDGAATSVTSATSGSNAGTITLPTSFFRGGFSNYNLTSTSGSVTVTPGTRLLVQQQNYQIAPGQMPVSGTPLSRFASLGVAPDGIRHAANVSASEIPFNYGAPGDPSTTAGIVLGSGASVVTDPGASVSLVSGRSVTVLGNIIDHGGAVTLAGALDTWIGAGAVIDVSGTFVPNPLVASYRTGTVLAGGSITFGLNPSEIQNQTGYGGNGAVIIQSGARLDLSGGMGTVQVPVSAGAVASQNIWSDGGTLVFKGSSNLYLGGTINAAGGAPDAAGGTIKIGDVVVSSKESNGYANNGYGSVVVAQSGDQSVAFSGASAPTTASQLSALLPQGNSGNTAYVTADTLSHSGFSTVVLNAGQIRFPGRVALSGLAELDLAGSLVMTSAGASTVDLAANYIRLIGYTQVAPTLGGGTLNIAATDQIDIEGAVSVSGAASVNLTSGGDIRMIWADGSALSAPLVKFPIPSNGVTIAAPVLSTTSLNVADSLTLTAREVYAATNTAGVLLSLGLGSNNTITIASNGATPVAPLSAGGSLLVAAPTIVQNGALYAPLGSIQLGVSASSPVPAGITLVGTAPTTSSVTLGAGSLTSVSIAGLDVPYSYTINGDWQTGTLPEKQITLAGANVTTRSGAVLDLRGGGDVYATEFVAGTGGSRNVLTTGSQTVYALVPGYGSKVSTPFPTDGYNLSSWKAGGTAAPSAFSLQAGMTVTLPGGNGVPAGTYTLMPAMYATLPGAYRVVVASSNINPGVPVSSVVADGTVYMTGVFGNAITSSRSAQTALLAIQSNAVWTRYSEIDISSANSAFTQVAIANGTVTPRLPIDAGHLILAATSRLDINATNLFAVGTATGSTGATLTGRGGLADVTGSNLLIVASDRAAGYAANSAYDGATFLDADQLSQLGVASLLIGGVRTTTTTGVAIAPAAISLTVATDAAHPLTAPDLILATGASITGTTTTTQVNAAAGAQTVTVATGLSGVTVGTGITLYDPANPVSWVQGTVTSYDPATGSLSFSGAAAKGSGKIANAAVLIATPGAGSGLVVADGSVVAAVGAVPTGTSQNIAIGAIPVATQTDSGGNVTRYVPGVSGDGALLRVSNGDDVTVTRAFLPGIYDSSKLPVAFGPVATSPQGRLNVGAATLQGNAITLDSSGANSLAADATLVASHYTLASNLINLGGSNPSGLTLTDATLARLAGAQTVTLHSYSAFNLYGNQAFGSANTPIGTLIFDGSGFTSDGGTVAVTGRNVTFVDSQTSPNVGGANTTGSGGALDVAASGAITFGAGAQTWHGLGQVAMTAASGILFSGSGSVAAGSANVTLTTPAIVADTGAAQSFTTTGALVLAPTGGALPTLASTMLGGKIALTGGSLTVSNAILAPGGSITLEASSGDVTLASGALVAARGSRVSLFGLFNEDVAAGTVKLIADTGNVTLASGSTVDVSAAGYGYAGTVSIAAASGTATLSGSVLGSAAYKDLGGTFVLNADRLAGSLPQGESFGGVYAVTLGHGDILVDTSQTISAGTIVLTANDGSVTINGALDASSPSGGTIALYGAGTTNGSGATATVTGGVNIGSTARLLARYQADDPNDPAYAKGNSTLVQNGGTITLGTSGIGSTTSLDPVQGYEIVLPGRSGHINVASGATFDISGGPGGTNISNTGGAVYLRAPIVENADGTGRSVNVSFNGTIITNADANGRPSGKGLVLQPYATWSTADQQTDTTKYFDGIIDPAGWYSSGGTLLAGTFKDATGAVITSWSGSSAPSFANVSSADPTVVAGTQVFTISPGLDLSPGQTVELANTFDAQTRIAGTVVSYDSATGALVINASSVRNGYNAGSWTLFSSKTGTLITYTGYGVLIGVGSDNSYQHFDPDGTPFWNLGGLPSNLQLTPGESLILSVFSAGDTNSIKTYAGTYRGFDPHYGVPTFYIPGLSAALAAGTSGANVTPITYVLGASSPVVPVLTQSAKIGTGTKVLTIPTAQSYVAGETITLTDRNAPGNSMTGTIAAYSPTTGALVLNVTSDTGDGNTPSGNWTFGVTIPQSVVNSFLANDYFTPTNPNTAHQTFYGFVNGNTTTPGTLMSFIQSPFIGNDAAALSGLSGAKIQIGTSGLPVSMSSAAMLHIGPEVNLVNPSSSVNGGDITVASNWNLGAGVAGADGNPASLYYRDNGWAPTITLRAAKDLNLDASITDGFFQKANTVNSFIPVTTTDTFNSANSAYLSTASTHRFSAENLGDLVPDTSATSLQNPNGMGLQAPATFSGETNTTVDQYYTDYKSYAAAYANYFSNAIDQNSTFFGSVAQGGTLPPASVMNLLAAARNAYSAANPASYSAYLSAYNTYVNAYVNWSFSVNTIGALPSAPLPPPSISNTGSLAPLVNNGPAPIRTPSNPSPIAGMDLVAEASSSSYRFVAGARFAPSGQPAEVNPETVLQIGSSGVNDPGDITLSGHLSYFNTALPTVSLSSGVTYYPRIDIPTIIRTGTGSIDMVASGDIKWLDALSPAAVYTAGTVAANASGFDAPALPTPYVNSAGKTGFNGLISTPTWATGGGAITLSAGRDIIGIETPVDSELLTVGVGTADAQTLGDNSPSMAQFWSAWYIPLSSTTGQAATPFASAAGGVQNSAYINYATFFQGVGALGGGNVTVNSGRNTYDLSVSLPETIQVSGGRFAGDSAPSAHYFGGGNLSVTVGNNLYSSDFYIGRGSGAVRVAGSVLTDIANPITGQATGVYASAFGGNSSAGLSNVPIAPTTADQFKPLPLLLAEQDGYISVQSGGSLALGGVFQPTRLPLASYPYNPRQNLPDGAGSGFDSFGPTSGVTLIASGGDLSIVDAFPPTFSRVSDRTAAGRTPDNLLPPNLEAISVAGNLTIGNLAAGGVIYSLYPSRTGNLILAAGQTLSTAYTQVSGGLILNANGIQMADATTSGGVALFNQLGTPTPTTLSGPLHADDPDLALIYAGRDIIGNFAVIKPARMQAGRDILDSSFVGQNNQAGDVTSIIAGRDIRSTNVIDGITYSSVNGGVSPGIDYLIPGATVLMLYGPGQFEVAAGRNLGPFLADPGGNGSGGIFAVGNGSNIGTLVTPNGLSSGVIPYLPVAGANITALFGVAPGMDVAAAITNYIDPATANVAGINYLPDIASQLGVSVDQAWAAFQALSPVKQKLVVERAFLDFLTQVNADYGNKASPYYQQYARAYQTIATLFPASLGYTENNSSGGNGASVRVQTGDLKMARSRIETQTGGDINILGPGGSITVGANQADTIPPNLEGVLTLQGGSIRSYTDGSVQVYQSRIFTEQGGNVELFSANGDLNAGKGPKSSAAYPPLQLTCDVDGYCRVSPAGLVTGAGVGALLSIPGQDPTRSNVVLSAPHGTVDAGAAGIRVSGNLNIVALQVLNAFNIQVGGATVGVPVTQGPPVGALTASNNVAGSAAKTAELPKQSDNNDQPSIIVVEFLGFGGGDQNQDQQPDSKRHMINDQHSYDINNVIQLVGAGPLTDAQKRALTEEERESLAAQ